MIPVKLKCITSAFDPGTGAFPPEPLADIDGDILSVAEHFFHHGGIPHLLFIVHYRPPEAARPVRSPPEVRDGRDPEATLTADERELYARLRAWRNGRARAEAVPSYILFANRQLVDIVRRRPTTVAQLRQVEGIGEARAEKYGAELLTVLGSARSGDASVPSPAEPGAAHE